MIERCERLGLALKAHQAIGVIGKRRGQDLQGDVAIEPRITGSIHLAHPTCPERAHDLIRAKARAWNRFIDASPYSS